MSTEDRIKEIEALLASVKAELAAEESEPIERAYIYHRSNYDGNIMQVADRVGSVVDNDYKTGNYHKSKSVVENRQKWLLKNGQFITKSLEFNEGWEPDWDDDYQKMYYVFINECKANVFYTNSNRIGSIYFKTEEQAQEMADWCNKFMCVKVEPEL